jgi:hypothetical protein
MDTEDLLGLVLGLLVYAVERDLNGRIRKEKLCLSLDEDMIPGTYIATETHVTIFTSHFTGFVCTTCQRRPPILRLRLYGNHEQNSGVTLILIVWDQRLRIADFEKV